MQEQNLNPEDRELEAALATLHPARPAFNASSLLALRLESSRRRLVIWRTATAALAACLVISFFTRPRIREVQQIIILPSEVSSVVHRIPIFPEDFSPTSYIMLRQRILDDSPFPATAPIAPPRSPIPGGRPSTHDNLRVLNQTAMEQL